MGGGVAVSSHLRTFESIGDSLESMDDFFSLDILSLGSPLE
jgi:hypothetical protein